MESSRQPVSASSAEGAALSEPWPVLTPSIVSQASAGLQSTPDAIGRKLDDVQREMDELRNECDSLRKRDHTLNFYMNRLDEELRLAARLQQDFLPKTMPQVGRVRFHTLFRPAGYVSGDMYDVMRLDERRVGFYVADAVGHGVPAALLTMFLKHALATKEISPVNYRLLPPSEALGRLNESLISQNLTQATFATAIYGMIDVESLTMKMARGGHPMPLVHRADGTITTVESDGGLLGVFPEETYQDVSIQLAVGDRLIVFTDGVEVAFGAEPSLDHTIWHRQLMDLRHLPGQAMIEELARRFDQANGSANPKDDLTVVVAEIQ